jgi:DNA-binding MarR family transcriptional regulator
MTSTEQFASGPFPGDQFHRFLRYGHVLRSLLREFLEEDFLRQICPHRLTRSQFCFLKLIAANSDLQVGELARSIGVSAAAASKNLDKLERLDLVIRETSSEDRRAILLSASPEGRRLVGDYERHKAARLMPVIDTLGEEKTGILCDLLEEVCTGILARVEEPRETCLRCAGYYRPDCVFEEFQGECALKPRRGGEAEA